ncbi:MAG: hypothetical protein QGG25_18760, partial [Phycisphaerae bacterium]|nr:hypothetical protein [Phycisphaerae bacterium]
MIKRFVTCLVLLAVCGLLIAPGGCNKADDPGGGAASGSGKFCVSLGWQENESGRRQKKGFEDAFKAFGGEATFANANYDA